MSKERLGAFMDAVIAIVMTILVLELEKPAKPTLEAFWNLRINFAAYALSFLWLAAMWHGKQGHDRVRHREKR